MEIDGEVTIEIDQYAPVNFEIDVGTLAEELCQSYNLVDDVVLREYVREYVTDMVQDEIRELSPDNNYVRINDLRDVIDAQIDLRVAGILNDVMKGIEKHNSVQSI
tara:strand:- start:71 stop:388 length:318 start_codon:yes stop_codon:yes gene_type:complete